MDMIVELLDDLIKERIKVALGDDTVGGRDETKLMVIKERLRRVLAENVLTG